MGNELRVIKNWGKIYIVLILLGAVVEIIMGLDSNSLLFGFGIATLVIDSIYAFALYVIYAKLKSQNIVIEQNKEIIKLLSK